jgi:hypothetical protein
LYDGGINDNLTVVRSQGRGVSSVKAKSKGKSAAQYRVEAKGYMLVCTDAQLRGVIERESQRLKGLSPLNEVARVARIMLDEAQIELRRRGLS